MCGKAVLRGNFIVLNAYVRKKENKKILKSLIEASKFRQLEQKEVKQYVLMHQQ